MSINNRQSGLFLALLALGASGCAAAIKPMEIRTFSSNQRAVSEVIRGQAVAAVGDYPVMAYEARESAGRLQVVGRQFDLQTLGIGVDKNAKELNFVMVDAIRHIAEDRKVGMEIGYPPMEFLDESKNEVGLDVELAQALAKVLGVELVIVDMPFDALIGALETGKIDLIISSMYITEERSKRLDFIPYLKAGSGIVVQQGNPKQILVLKDLCGQVVAVQEGTSQLKTLKAQVCDQP